jgi:hypothetical protein
MNVDLPIQETVAFAREHYQDKASVYEKTLLDHSLSVARMAEKIAIKLYSDVRKDLISDETQESVAVIVHSAVLHDLINVSRCAFEQIAERTTVQVAATVADLSRDFRLVETKRDMEYRGRLSQSGVKAQIVATADIICTTMEVLKMLKGEGVTAVPRARKILMQLDGDLLAITAASRFYQLRLYTHAARNHLHDASQLIKECKAEARAARQFASTSARIAAKRSAEEKPAKEKPSAKKRTRRRDP